MKKSLSLLLAVLLAFSAFTFSAFAQDELTTEEKYNKLVELEIFSGFPDGQAHLDLNMNRAQAAKIIALILGLGENPAAAGIYTDIVGSDDEWALGYIGSATEAGILEGRGDGIFAPSDNVTIQELAAIMVRALDIDYDEDATVEGASDWAGKYVKAALDAGLLPPQSDYTVPASRALLVEASFAAYEQVTGGEEEEVAVTATAAATGAKKITVTFNQPVDDTKAQFSVKYNNNTVNASSVTFSDDKTSADIVFPNNLVTGDYTVTVSGLTDEPLSLTLKVEASKVAKIEFTTSSLLKDRDDDQIVTAGYQVLNQYGEKINDAVVITASKGTPTTENNNTIKLTVDGDAKFTIGEKVAISVMSADGSTFATNTFEVVAAPYVSSVAITQLYQKDNKELVAETGDPFFLLLDLKDQYGNAVTSAAIANQDLFVIVSNEAVASVEGYTNNSATFTANADGNGTLGLKLAPKDVNSKITGGLTQVTLVSRLTGARASFDISVKEKAKVDVLTLSSPSLAVAEETVEIPFTAIDQFGNEIKSPSLALSVTQPAKIGFKTDPITKETKLILDLKDIHAKTTVVISGTTDTFKPVLLQVSVSDPAVPVRADGLKGNTTLLAGDSRALNLGDVILKDQYGRDFSGSNLPANYKVKVSKSGDAISVVDNGNQATDYAPATIKADKKGNATLTLSLWNTDTNKEVSNSSSPSIAIRVVDNSDVTTYDASVSGTVYDNDEDYGVPLKVEGILADGTRVAVPYNNGDNYTVLIPTASDKLEFDADNGVIYSEGGFVPNNATEAQGTVIVTVLLNNQVIPVTVNVSSKEPEIATLALKDVNTDDVKKQGDLQLAVEIGLLEDRDALIDLLQDVIEAKDQYGKVKADFEVKDQNVFVTGAKSDLSDIAKDKTFRVLVFADNGLPIDITILVFDKDV